MSLYDPSRQPASRVPADDRGGTAARIIDLTGSGPETFRVLFAHVLGKVSREAPVIFEEHESASRYVMVSGCQDCLGRAVTAATRPHGFQAAVVIEHDPTCPALREALQAGGGI